MIPLPPSIRRANLVVFVALVIFALALAAACLLWMRGVVRANGGVVDPHRVGLALPVMRANFEFV